MQQINIFWFRRDLRLHDNAGLYHALKSNLFVLPVFIFDKNILDKLEDKQDRRVEFIYHALEEMQNELISVGSTLEVYYGTPEEVFRKLIDKYLVVNVFANHDYEPYATGRDASVSSLLQNHGIYFNTYKDQVIFEKNEVIKEDGKPYSVFTPYCKKWKSTINDACLEPHKTENLSHCFFKQQAVGFPSFEMIGFQKTGNEFPENAIEEKIIQKYSEQRDFPSINGTSKLGVHLRFGTISIRYVVSKAMELNETFLNELIWREFYQMILWHFPQVDKAFKPAYDNIQWRHDEGEFERWCKGQTGYPIVDAGMRELNNTGYMHNRVRMIVASFLCKHLLLDWRLGEAYFASKLLDFDLASNNGGWQWASGSGCDAAPYFRIFNPYLQTKKFDGEMRYVKKWVPEFMEDHYPRPIVDHEFARKRCLQVYGEALKKK
jgi:deoxyribodipyrimidine photo-lyase